MRAKYLAAAFMLLAFGFLSAPAAPAQTLPPQSAWQANAHQLGARVLKLIQQAEQSQLNCQVRNVVIRRLRLLYDALTTGRGFAARGFLTAGIKNVRVMQGANLLTPEEGAALQIELADILQQVGGDWPTAPPPTRRWPKLATCETKAGGSGRTGTALESVAFGATLAAADRANRAAGSYQPFELNDCEHILHALVSEIPVAGAILGALVMILWPDEGPDIYALVEAAKDEAAKEAAINDLNNIKRSLDNFLSIAKGSPDQAGDAFIAAQGYIYSGLGTFQWNHTGSGGEDYRIEFLPLFAQGENLYLALLREGVLHGSEWGWDADTLEYWKSEMRKEVDGVDKERGLGYVMDIYALGLSKQPAGSGQSDWTKRNKYVRDRTLDVLDFAEIWKHMDPYIFPNGAPNLKLTRMIYSDPIGVTDHTFRTPAYAYGPLRKLTVWTDRKANFPFVDAMQESGGPTAGPLYTGSIMGDSDLGDDPTRYDYEVAPGSTPGPIVTVEGNSAQYEPGGPQRLTALNFGFANGTESGRLGSLGPPLAPGTRLPNNVGSYSLYYPGEAVATVLVMGKYRFEPITRYGADSVVFGFRFADSYYPSGEVLNVQGGCLRAATLTEGAPVVLGSGFECMPAPSNTWTYHSALRQLRIIETFCLDISATSTAIVKTCKNNFDQSWTVTPSGTGGTIGRGGLVLTGGAAGAPISLTADTGANSQRWKTPNAVQGAVHSSAAGKCLDVSSLNDGTPARIYTCTGVTAGQTWTYSPSMGTLSLSAGTVCLDVPGTAVAGSAVQVKACNASSSQRWSLMPDASIQHWDSGLFLDLLNRSTDNSTPLVLQSAADFLTQKWTWPMF